MAKSCTGRITSALILGTVRHFKVCMIGKTNANVFPLPVGAETQISDGQKNLTFQAFNNWGMTCLKEGKWIQIYEL